MPVYDYACAGCGTVTEARRSIHATTIHCPKCRRMARRVGVYREQYMQAETGPREGSKNPVPLAEKSYRQDFAEFREAAAEVDDGYARTLQAGDPPPREVNYYKEGVKRARAKNPKVRAL